MELRRYLTVIRRRWWLILLTPLLTAAAGYSFADKAEQYSAQTTLFLGPLTISLDPEDFELSNDRLAALDRVSLTYSHMIDSRPIAELAIENLDLDLDIDELVEDTESEPEPATQLIYVTVTRQDPEEAAALANALTDAFIERIEQLGGPGTSEDSQIPAYVFERASLPEAPLPTDEIQTLILGALFGLVAGVGIAFLLEYLDLSIRTAADAERHLELPVLGVVPAVEGGIPLGEPALVQPRRAGASS